MISRFRHFLIFGITLAVLIAGLKMLNWLPSVVQDGTMKKYENFAEVQSRLHIRNLFVPSFYPEYLRWPPTLIAAQSKPFAAVLTEFVRKGKNDVCLVIFQIALPHSMPNNNIRISNVKETVRYSLKGRDAVLMVGVCKKTDEPCSQMSWVEDQYRISVSMKSTPFDLIKVAESMVH